MASVFRNSLPIKILLALFMTNILTMAVMNVGVVETDYLVWVYSVMLLLSSLIVKMLGIKSLSNSNLSFSKRENRLLKTCFVLLFACYVLPRSGYLAECFLGYVINPINYDDWWHLEEINSLVNTERYPPVSSFDPDKYLSFYYAPWLLIAFIYRLVSFDLMTIKTALCLGNAIYILLLLYSLGYIASTIAKGKSQFYFLLYSVLLYSGVESLIVFLSPLSYNTWWMHEYFGIHIKFCTFFVNAIWAMHHLTSAFSLVMSAFIFLRIKSEVSNKNLAGYCSIALLFAYAFYSSVFVFIGALPYLALILVANARNYGKRLFATLLSSGLLASSFLWIYLGKEPGFFFPGNVLAISPNWILNSVLSFLLFIVLVSMNFCLYFVIIGISLKCKKLSRLDITCLLLSLLYVLSIFFVEYKGSNNYAIRGSIIPVFVLIYISSKHIGCINFKNKWVIVALAFLSLGSVNVCVQVNLKNVYRAFVKPYSDVETRRSIYTLNTNREIRSIDYDHLESVVRDNRESMDDEYHYLIEKLILNYHKELSDPDIELMHDGPFSIWKSQRWNE